MNKDLKLYSLNLLVKREYTRKKLQEKVTARFPDTDWGEVKEVFDWLESENYLSDSRFAELFVRQKIRTGDGPSKIKQKLYEKGVSSEIASEALEAYEQKDMYDNALRLGQKKYESIRVKESDIYKRRAKVQNFLASRGFGMRIISDVVGEVEKEFGSK